MLVKWCNIDGEAWTEESEIENKGHCLDRQSNGETRKVQRVGSCMK